MNLEDRYLETLKRMLCRYDLEGDGTWAPIGFFGGVRKRDRLLIRVIDGISELLLPKEIRLAKFYPYFQEHRYSGKDWPYHAETMVGLSRLNQMHRALESIEDEGIPGHVLEAGVWRGGVGIFSAAFLSLRAENTRKVYLADSFSGLPKPSEQFEQDRSDIHHTIGYLSASEAEVRANFGRYLVPLEGVEFVSGYFQDTMPTLDVDQLAILRLDGDMYESTAVVLANLYDRVSPGGFVIVDDWTLPARKAVEDFLSTRAEHPTVVDIDGSSVYFRK